jgi:uncharacterized protein
MRGGRSFRLVPSTVFSSLAVMLTLASGAIAQPAPAGPFINILTSGTGGVYYPLGGALSGIFDAKISGARPSVQTTKGSVENLNLLQQGKGEIALTLGNALALAWAGDADAGFKGKLDKLRGIAAIYPSYVQIVATKESGIRTLTDLKGKRLAVNARGSGTEINTRALLNAAGMSYKDLGKVVFVPYEQGVELMWNRQIDAAFALTGLGTPALREFANAHTINVVEIPARITAKVGVPFVRSVIPKGTYKGQDAEVQTATILNYLVTRADVSSDLVYTMTKVLFESTAELAKAHSAAAEINLERALDGMPVPLHPGAQRFFKEKGLVR